MYDTRKQNIASKESGEIPRTQAHPQFCKCLSSLSTLMQYDVGPSALTARFSPSTNKSSKPALPSAPAVIAILTDTHPHLPDRLFRPALHVLHALLPRGQYCGVSDKWKGCTSTPPAPSWPPFSAHPVDPRAKHAIVSATAVAPPTSWSRARADACTGEPRDSAARRPGNCQRPADCR